MNTGILAHKLKKRTHCGEFILCQTYYVLGIQSHKKLSITTAYHFWSTVWAAHSIHGGSISTEWEVWKKYRGVKCGFNCVLMDII